MLRDRNWEVQAGSPDNIKREEEFPIGIDRNKCLWSLLHSHRHPSNIPSIGNIIVSKSVNHTSQGGRVGNNCFTWGELSRKRGRVGRKGGRVGGGRVGSGAS